MVAWNIRGLGKKTKQDEVRNLIRQEGVQVCAILETKLKSSNIQKVGDKVFDGWNWISNMAYCDKGCIMLIGWNQSVVNVMVINMSKQSYCAKLKL